jgi:hypothetical protein
MALAAAVILFARLKTKGWIRGLLSIFAFVSLLLGMLCGLVAMI